MGYTYAEKTESQTRILTLGVTSTALACDYSKATPTMAKLSIEQAKKAKPTFVDANSQQTRESQGVILGAVLLTSNASFQSSELPKNKNEKLAFYCANEMCSASKKAATRALEAGYTDVAILPAGVMGWVKAGMKTVAVTKKTEPKS